MNYGSLRNKIAPTLVSAFLFAAPSVLACSAACPAHPGENFETCGLPGHSRHNGYQTLLEVYERDRDAVCGEKGNGVRSSEVRSPATRTREPVRKGGERNFMDTALSWLTGLVKPARAAEEGDHAESSAVPSEEEGRPFTKAGPRLQGSFEHCTEDSEKRMGKGGKLKPHRVYVLKMELRDDEWVPVRAGRPGVCVTVLADRNGGIRGRIEEQVELQQGDKRQRVRSRVKGAMLGKKGALALQNFEAFPPFDGEEGFNWIPVGGENCACIDPRATVHIRPDEREVDGEPAELLSLVFQVDARTGEPKDVTEQVNRELARLEAKSQGSDDGKQDGTSPAGTRSEKTPAKSNEPVTVAENATTEHEASGTKPETEEPAEKRRTKRPEAREIPTETESEEATAPAREVKTVGRDNGTEVEEVSDEAVRETAEEPAVASRDPEPAPEAPEKAAEVIHKEIGLLMPRGCRVHAVKPDSLGEFDLFAKQQVCRPEDMVSTLNSHIRARGGKP